MRNLGEQHMNGDMRILRYMNTPPRKGIVFTKNEYFQSVNAYTNADWVGAVDDMHSTLGYFTFVGGNLVTWRSKKHNIVSQSSAEDEFRGMTLGVCESLWLRLLCRELGYPHRQQIKLYWDKKVACDIAYNQVQHDQTKHVEVRIRRIG